MQERVLVISNDDNLKNELREILTSAGYKPLLSSFGKNLKALVKKAPVIIIDIDGFGEEGKNLIKEIKNISPYNELIVLGKGVSGDEAIALLRLGANDFIIKPYQAQELIKSVSGAFEARNIKLESVLYKERLEDLLTESVGELQKRNTFLQSIFDNIPLGIAFISDKLTVIEANRLWARYAELTPQEVGGLKCPEIEKIFVCGSPCPAEVALKEMKQASRVISTPEGLFLKFYWVPIQEMDICSGFLEIIEDITEEVKAKGQWEAILSSLSEGVCILNDKLEIVWANKLFNSWFGPPYNKQGENFHFLYFTETNKQLIACSVIKEKKQQKKRLNWKINGEEKIFEITASPMFDENGNIFQIVELIKDITDQERMIKELEQKTNTLNELNLQNIERINSLTFTVRLSDALLTTDDLNQIYHIVLTIATAKDGFGFNRAFLLLYDSRNNSLYGGYGLGPLYPEEASEVWPELEDVELEELLSDYEVTMLSPLTERIGKYSFSLDEWLVFQRAMKEKSPIKVALEELPKDFREEFGLSDVYIMPLIGRSNPIGVLVGDNFITHAELDERKEKVLRLFLNQASLAVERAKFSSSLRDKLAELEELNRALKESQDKLIMAEKLSAIGEMTAKIAHEIRNPLTVIGGFANILLQSLTEEDQRYRRAKAIVEETTKVVDMLNSLLDFSRFLQIRPTLSDLNSTVHNTIILFKHEFQKSNIDLLETYDRTLPMFFFDGGAFRQVLINLVKNAIDAMPQGGRLKVKTFKGKRYAYLKVEDTGLGISKEAKGKIFEPFFTTRSTGTGLGLTISKQIIEAMKGEIWFKTTINKGTKFFVKIPINIEAGG